MSFLVDNLLPTGSINNLIGKPKIGKSTLLRQLAADVAMGRDFLGRPTSTAHVLYFALEEQKAQLWDHFESLGATDDTGIFATTDMIHGDVLEQLGQALDSRPEARLILIDPLFKFVRPKDSNDYAETSSLLDSLSQFARARDLTIVCAHHEKKRQTEDVGDGTLGSTAIRAGSDTNLYLKQGKDGARILQTEQRYGIAMEPTLLQFDTALRRFVLDVSVMSSQHKEAESQKLRLKRQICEYVASHPEGRQSNILGDISGSSQSIVQTLRVMVEDGQLDRKGSGAKGDPHTYSVRKPEVKPDSEAA